MAKEEKRQAAKDLYMTGKHTQDRISTMLGVNGATITKWKNADDWENERDKNQRLAVSSETNIREIIDFNIMVLQSRVRQQKALLASGEMEAADLKLIDGKETDALSKLFAQIKSKEMTFSDKVNNIMKFLDFVAVKDKAIVETILPYFDEFIQSLIKNR